MWLQNNFGLIGMSLPPETHREYCFSFSSVLNGSDAKGFCKKKSDELRISPNLIFNFHNFIANGTGCPWVLHNYILKEWSRYFYVSSIFKLKVEWIKIKDQMKNNLANMYCQHKCLLNPYIIRIKHWYKCFGQIWHLSNKVPGFTALQALQCYFWVIWST